MVCLSRCVAKSRQLPHCSRHSCLRGRHEPSSAALVAKLQQLQHPGHGNSELLAGCCRIAILCRARSAAESGGPGQRNIDFECMDNRGWRPGGCESKRSAGDTATRFLRLLHPGNKAMKHRSWAHGQALRATRRLRARACKRRTSNRIFLAVRCGRRTMEHQSWMQGRARH